MANILRTLAALSMMTALMPARERQAYAAATGREYKFRNIGNPPHIFGASHKPNQKKVRKLARQ